MTGDVFPAQRPSRITVPPIVKIAIVVLVLVGIGLGTKQGVSPGPPPACVFACASPPIGPSLPVQATFTSPTWRFSFDYPSDWQPVTVSRPGVVGLDLPSGSFAGAALIAAGSATSSLTGLIDTEAGQLSRFGLTNVQDQGALNGAEIGFEPGQGEFYSGQYTAPTGAVYPVSAGIMAVQRPGEWVYLVGVSRDDPSSNKPYFFGDFDDILDRWRWTG